MEVERRPACCDCIARLALAHEHDALSRMASSSPADLARALMRAVTLYERAAQCGQGRNAYAAAGRELMQRYRDVMSDADPAHWIAVTSVEDPDRRVDGVIAHATFHGDRCQHDVAREYRAYIASMGAVSTSRLRSRLAVIPAGPVGEELFRLYLSHRLAELPAGDDREIEVLEQVRTEFRGTPYARMAERLLAEQVAGVDEPAKLDRLCRAFEPGPARDSCRARVQDLWTAAIVGAPLRQLMEICPRIDSPQMRAQCQTALAEEALRLITDSAPAEDLVHAEAVLRKADPRFQTEWRIRLLRRDAEQNFRRMVEHELELRAVPESVDAWDQFMTVFDTLAAQVSGGKQESLRSIHPELVRRITERRRKAARTADELYRRYAGDCRAEETKGRRGEPGVRSDILRRCVDRLAMVLTIDRRHARAEKLLTEVQEAAARLTVESETGWTDIVLPLVIAEALRHFVSPTLARIVFRTLRGGDF